MKNFWDYQLEKAIRSIGGHVYVKPKPWHGGRKIDNQTVKMNRMLKRVGHLNDRDWDRYMELDHKYTWSGLI
jgi:hypothetical protein